MGNRRVEYVAKPSRQGFRTDYVSDSYLRTDKPSIFGRRMYREGGQDTKRNITHAKPQAVHH